MKFRVTLAGALAGLAMVAQAPASAQASDVSSFQTQEPLFKNALTEVERAFKRRQSLLDKATGLRPTAPASLADLRPYGFFTTHPNITFTVSRLDEARSQVCVQMKVASKSDYHAAAQIVGMPGIVRTDASCNPLKVLPKLTWPTTVYALKILDTEDVMSQTSIPGTTLLSGVTNSRTMPGLTLYASPGQWSSAALISVTNPALPAAPGGPAAPVLDITQAVVRDGFKVEHNCNAVPAQYTCSVLVRYFGSAEQFRVGSLKLGFNSGGTVVVSLLGKKLKNPNSVPTDASPVYTPPATVVVPDYVPPTAIPGGVVSPGPAPVPAPAPVVVPAPAPVVVPAPVPVPTPSLPLCNDPYKRPSAACIPPGHGK